MKVKHITWFIKKDAKAVTNAKVLPNTGQSSLPLVGLGIGLQLL